MGPELTVVPRRTAVVDLS